MSSSEEPNDRDVDAESIWTPAHRWVAGLTVSTGLIGSVIFYTGPKSSKADVWMTSTGVMLALMIVGVFLFRRDHLRAWLLVVGGLSSAYVAMFLMNYGSWFGLEFGAPSVLDGLMLSNYPLAAMGALLMLGRHHLRTGVHALLETATLTVAGGLLIFVIVGVPSSQAATSNAAAVVATLYPLGNVMLLAVLAAVAVRLKTRPAGVLLVALGFLGNLLADVISSWQKIEGTYSPGGWVDFGWLLCFIGLSIAPSWPEKEATLYAERIDEDEGQVTAGRLIVVLFAVFVAPAVLIGLQLRSADAVEAVATVGTVGVFALTLGRVALDGAYIRRKEAALIDANAQLRRADEDKRSLLWRLNRAVEEERKRIAAEIHDRPVQELAAVSYKIETISVALVADDVDRASDLVDEVADELMVQVSALRNLMVEVRPPVLDERGLFGAIKDAGKAFDNNNAGITVTVTGADVTLDPEIETVLYRVAQEAFTNVAKHADAKTIEVELQVEERSVHLVIRDDGCGFDTDDQSNFVRQGHFGLAGMGERLAMVAGDMNLTSRPGEGTEIRFTVPHVEEDALTTTGVE